MPVLGRVVLAEPEVIMSWIGVVGDVGMGGTVFVSGIGGGGRSIGCVSMRGIGGRTGGWGAGRGGVLAICCREPIRRWESCWARFTRSSVLMKVSHWGCGRHLADDGVDVKLKS